MISEPCFYLDLIPPTQRPQKLLAPSRQDGQARFLELVDSTSARVEYPVNSGNEVVTAMAEGTYFAGALCAGVLGADGRVAMVYPPLGWVDDEEPIQVGDAPEHLQQVTGALEDAQTRLDEEMSGLTKVVDASRADITQAQEDAAAAILEAIATRDAAMMGAVDWYATTPTPDSPPATGWSTTPPEWGGGAYIWRKTIITHGDGTKVEGTPALITGNQGPAGTGAALVRIDSTRGTVFKEAGFSTDLQATVFSGAKQITDIYGLWEEFGPTAYLEWWWRKHDDSDFGLISSADTRLSQAGFRLTVSPADVDVSTVFQCVLHA